MKGIFPTLMGSNNSIRPGSHPNFAAVLSVGFTYG